MSTPTPDINSPASYTLILGAGKKTRYAAGPYDQDSHTPHYAISFIAPDVEARGVQAKQSLIKSADGLLWIYDIRNDSLDAVFVLITKDGSLLVTS